MRILGISAFYHDSAAALIEDGRIVAAAQEERFTRKKHDPAFPQNAAAYCLAEAGCGLGDVDAVAFYEKPLVKFERLLETYLAFAPRGFRSFSKALPVWIREKLFQKDLLIRELRALDGGASFEGDRLLFAEHHQSHAASAFYPSPFERAAILTMDGVGEWCTTSIAMGDGASLRMEREIRFPHSLGLLYSAFTYYLGFRVNSGEYKVMGLAPYGEPRYARAILDNLIDLRADGSFRLNLSYFNYCTGLTMTNGRFDALFGGPPRTPEGPISQREMDLAASVQAVVEEAVLRLGLSLAKDSGAENLCLAGGVALNCVANGKLLRRGAFRDIWVQPAAGDAGGALGAALAAYHGHFGQPRKARDNGDDMQGAFLGPAFSDAVAAEALEAAGARFATMPDEAALIDHVAETLAEGKAVGWMQGRMEFGPRALGARSILADPRSPTMQQRLNLKIKYRESFRPFAPAVLAEAVSDWFAFDRASPYMLMVAPVADGTRKPETAETENLSGFDKLSIARSGIPAVTHVDHSARVQTVHRETNPRFHALLRAFGDRTGCPVLINTSFNMRGEPIVCAPEDAFRCFMATGLDLLVIGSLVLRKEDQDPSLRHNYSGDLEPD